MLVCRLVKIDVRAMRLMLLRHAKADKAEAGVRDQDRPLNPRGKKDATTIGAYLFHHRLVPDLALSSPVTRTRQTWEAMARELSSHTPPARFDDRLYNADAEAILAVLRGIEAGARTLMVLGHNPGLHDFACKLIASGEVEAREALREGLPTAGLAVIALACAEWRHLHFHAGRLEHFVTPRSLATADRV
jgi:phosphohistidine phosphatase